jgi:hypothetical protein
VPLRITYDSTRDKAFSWRDSDNNLLEFSMTTGAVTAVGQTHPNGTYRIGSTDQPSRGFFVAPPANCDQ